MWQLRVETLWVLEWGQAERLEGNAQASQPIITIQVRQGAMRGHRGLGSLRVGFTHRLA